MCQVLPLSTFLFHLIPTTRRWHLHGPESEHSSLTSPCPSPDRTWNRFQGWLLGWGDLRQEGWPEQRVSLSTRGQMTKLSPKFCSQGRRPRRPSSQLVAWWRGRFRAGIQVPSCVCHWWGGGVGHALFPSWASVSSSAQTVLMTPVSLPRPV